MRFLRRLAAVGCLCGFAVPALADSTVQDFSNPGVKGTNYAEYGTKLGGGYSQSGGPAGAPNFYRLTQAFIGSDQNQIAFSLTAPGPTAHVVGSFNFRIGGQPACHADGMSIVLIDNANYPDGGDPSNPANGPSISEEGSTNRGGGLGICLDDYNNGNPYDVNPAPGLPNGTDDDEVSVNIISFGQGGGGRYDFVYGVDLWSTTGLQYNMHQNNLDDANTPFDHCDFTVDIDPAGGGATVKVYITSSQKDGTGGQRFQALSVVVPGVLPYEMRVGFGGRTGGCDDTHDIANVNVSFSPP